jgi:hypothetical protein
MVIHDPLILVPAKTLILGILKILNRTPAAAAAEEDSS